MCLDQLQVVRQINHALSKCIMSYYNHSSLHWNKSLPIPCNQQMRRWRPTLWSRGILIMYLWPLTIVRYDSEVLYYWHDHHYCAGSKCCHCCSWLQCQPRCCNINQIHPPLPAGSTSVSLHIRSHCHPHPLHAVQHMAVTIWYHGNQYIVQLPMRCCHVVNVSYYPLDQYTVS